MKKIILGIIILLSTGCLSRAEQDLLGSYRINAKVLSINDNILRGNMIGQFLGGSDGAFANDIIIAGVEFNFVNYLYLRDIKITHSEAAYFANEDKLPLIIKLVNSQNGYLNAKVYLKGVYKFRLEPIYGPDGLINGIVGLNKL